MLLFSFCFGDAKRNKVTKKEKRRLSSALTVNLCNISFKKETGCAFNKVRWAQAAPLKPLAKSGALAPEPPSKATKSLRRRYAPQNSRVQFVAPQGLTPQGFAQC